MDPLKKLKERLDNFPKTESNSMCFQMAALETARDKLRKFCQTLPKCSGAYKCDTCEIGDKIWKLDKRIEDLGDLQNELDIDTDEYLL